MKTLNEIRHLVHQRVQSLESDLMHLSQLIYSHPEVSTQEFKAHDWLCGFMEQKGFHVQRQAYGIATAFQADASMKQTADIPTVVFLSEYDALPNLGHACGHHLIAILGVACAIVCRDVSSLLEIPPFHTRLLGTPAEETIGGKIQLLNAGAFKDADIVLMAHPGNEHVVHGNWLALQSFQVDYFGKSAHASAAPWKGINALDAAVNAYTSLSLVRQQILPTDRIHGIITKGGDAPNIIPEHSQMKYYIRSQTSQQLNLLQHKVNACFKAASLATGCSMEMTMDPMFAHVKSNQVLGEIYKKEMELQGIEFASDVEFIPRGSTDMGNVSQLFAGIHPIFSLSQISKLEFSYHTKEFEEFAATPEAFSSTFTCAKALIMTALSCILDPNIMCSVKKEFESTE